MNKDIGLEEAIAGTVLLAITLILMTMVSYYAAENYTFTVTPIDKEIVDNE